MPHLITPSQTITAYFKDCRKNDTKFDSCIKDALNDVRPLFKTGVPDFKIDPFDPFFAEEVPYKRGGQFFNIKLRLKNVHEAGWTISQVTRFRSDFNKNMVQYTQFFPDKRLWGEYEVVGTVLGSKMANQGLWNLTLYDYSQTTTVTKKPGNDASGKLVYNTPLKVSVDVQTCKDLKLHISHLLGGRPIFENMLDRIINNAWQPGFAVLRPIINELVSTAFTGIFNKAFQNFPFDEIIK